MPSCWHTTATPLTVRTRFNNLKNRIMGLIIAAVFTTALVFLGGAILGEYVSDFLGLND